MAKRGAHLMKPLRVTEVLENVIGKSKASRGECIKLVWKYIKRKKLNEGRTIFGKMALKELFDGKKKIDMMQLAGYVFRNIISEKKKK